MPVEFRVHTDDGPISDPMAVGGVVKSFREFAQSHPEPYVIVHSNSMRGRPRQRAEAAERIQAICDGSNAGNRFRVVSGESRFFVHAVETDPPMANVPGVPNVKAWVAILKDKWPAARLAGTCVAKDDSTDHCNGHNDCAACDDFDTDAHMEEQRDHLIDNAEEFGVSYVILHDRIWTFGPPRTNSSRGFQHYNGDFHHHVHASFTGGICGIAARPASERP
jgi:hypothetical protein